MFTKNFKELSKNDALIAGGKGASLGEMTQVGISVPPGFVVIADAFGKFLEETDLNVEIESILAAVDIQKVHTIEKASEKIQGLILEAKMPEEIKSEIEKEFEKLKKCHCELDSESQKDKDFFVAVRSSATAEDGADHAWAGQLNSYLNTTKENLLENIQKCWASLFTPRAIFYRFEKGLHDTHISVAVVVQKMIQSEKSGIAFSVHPVTEDYNQLIIEAGYGLGEAVVSGSITPDSYVVDKSRIKDYELRIKNGELRIEGAIIDVNVNTQTRGLYRACHLDRSPSLDDLGRSGEISGNEWREISEPQASSQVLNEKEILELSDLIIKIENHYNFPCDIEWAQENGEFYITQSRPITTLRENKVNVFEKQDNEKFLDNLNINDYIYVSNREISLLEMSLIIESYKSQYGKIKYLQEFGKFLSDQTIIIGKGQSVNMYRTKKSIKDAGKCAIDLIKNDKSLLKKLFKVSVKIANIVDIKCEILEKEIKSKNISRERLYEFYREWRSLFIEIFPMQVLPLGFERSLEFSEKDILLDNKHILVEWRDKTQLTQMRLEKIFSIFLKKSHDSLDKDLRYYSDTEVIKYLEQSVAVNDEEIKSREKSYVMIWSFEEDISYEIYSGVKIDQVIFHLENKNLKKEINNGILIGGGIGSGSCKSAIFIMKNKGDLDKFPPGVIVVARVLELEDIHKLTNKKIGGVIVEEGGITSHIAISGRELRVPIVSGIKNIVQILKDGDLVEVDAERGIVKILKKAEADNEDRHIRDKKDKAKSRTEQSSGSGAENGVVRILEKAKEVEMRQNFVKIFNRAMYIIACQIYDNGERIELNKTTRGKYFWDPLLLNNPRRGTDVYYSFSDPSQDPKILVDVFNNDRIFLHELKEKFYILCDQIREINQDKNFGDFKRLYELTAQLFPMVGISNALGDERDNIKGVDKDLKPIYMEMRKYSDGLIHNSFIQILKILKKIISEKYAGYVEYICFEEIVSGVYPSLEELEKRRQGYIFHRGKLYAGEEKDEYLEKNNIELKGFSSSKNEEGEIKGEIAFNGKIKGVVKTVFELSDVKKVKNGDILIASMTTPDFIVAMKKAGAFVTDEGGITCHASIIAREMKKPCIIGTKIATQVLKDGDLVEVDAERGIVKILK